MRKEEEKKLRKDRKTEIKRNGGKQKGRVP